MSLTKQQALEMFRSDDLIGIGMEADAVRRKLHPEGTVTYIIDRNINYTNFCTEYCTFCAFYRPLKGPASVERQTVLLRRVAVPRSGPSVAHRFVAALAPLYRHCFVGQCFAAVPYRGHTVALHERPYGICPRATALSFALCSPAIVAFGGDLPCCHPARVRDSAKQGVLWRGVEVFEVPESECVCAIRRRCVAVLRCRSGVRHARSGDTAGRRDHRGRCKSVILAVQ